jgi:hypothetical protein
MSRSYINALRGSVSASSNSSGSTFTPANASDTTLKLATAQQAPMIAKSENEHEDTKSVVVPNYDGGLSFSVHECFNWAIRTKSTDIASKCLVTLVERLAIFGTSQTRIDISATKLTDESRDLFYKLAMFDCVLVCKTLRSIYVDNRAPKSTHLCYLISLLTSATIKNAGYSQEMMVKLRSAGYDLVPMFRMTTHLF